MGLTIFLYLIAAVFLATPIASLPYAYFMIRYVPLRYLEWLIKSPLALAIYIITYILAPFLALLSIILKVDVLPYPLSLFHTHDDTLDGGQHQLGWPSVTGIKLWWQRTNWMWRNPAYGFDAYVWGYPADTITPLIVKTSKHKWSEKGVSSREFHVFETNHGKKLFALVYKWFYTKDRCVRVWIGWRHTALVPAYHVTKFKNALHPFRKDD